MSLSMTKMCMLRYRVGLGGTVRFRMLRDRMGASKRCSAGGDDDATEWRPWAEDEAGEKDER